MAREVIIPRQVIPETSYRVLEGSKLPAYFESIAGYKEIAKKVLTGNGNPLFDKDGEFAGSNTWMILHLIEKGLLGADRIATRSDTEKALSLGLNLLGNYVDFGIALRGERVSLKENETSARNLVSQLKDREISLGDGRLIPYSALTKKEDSNSGYGFTLSLKDDVSADSLPELAQFRWDWTTHEGIARAYLSIGGYWGSKNINLNSSSDFGRVVVVSSKDEFQNSLGARDEISDLEKD